MHESAQQASEYQIETGGSLQSARYPNLYFEGAGTHPGAGVPGVVSSAAVVERLVTQGFGALAQSNQSGDRVVT